MKRIKYILIFTLILVLSSGCVKIIKEGEESLYTNDSGFQALDNINEIWDDQALPLLETKAVDVVDFITESNGDFQSLASTYGSYSMGDSGELSYTVKGSGVITSVVTDKKAGYVLLNVEGNTDPNIEIKIQIGSVFKGSSVRDSLDFIKFDDYKNQVEYAELSQTINNFLQEDVLDKFSWEELEGSEIAFLGCFTVDKDNEILIMPVKLFAE